VKLTGRLGRRDSRLGNLILGATTEAVTMPTPILDAATAALAVMQANAVTLGATPWYQRALIALWRAGTTTGIDPAVLAGQCGHETGWGTFGRAVTPNHGNTAGIKIRDIPAGALDSDPDIHARFAIGPGGHPWVGALAHAHHLMLYAGIPVPDDTPDPRAVWIQPGTPAFGAAPNVEDLSGKWAPSPSYGTSVVTAIRKVRGW
jgi:hypothetical protein